MRKDYRTGNMKRLALMLVVIALLLAAPSLVLAQEEAKYNFASAQGAKEIKVVPGGEGWGVIYFYNIDGNRITHITLDVSQVPDSWDVEIQPPQHEIEVEITGRIVAVTENLHVEPSEVLAEEAEDVPEGMVCITIPTRGYALANPVYIVVRVPDGEEIGTRGDILISAEAAWLGQSGAAAIKQARDFDFSVEVVSESTEFTETIVGEGDSSEATGSTENTAGKGGGSGASNPGETTVGDGGSSGFPIMKWLPAIIAGVVVILGAVLIPRLVARRKGGD